LDDHVFSSAFIFTLHLSLGRDYGIMGLCSLCHSYIYYIHMQAIFLPSPILLMSQGKAVLMLEQAQEDQLARFNANRGAMAHPA
jgi:hypothetical protein